MKRPLLAVLAFFALVAVFTSGCAQTSYSTRRHQMTNTVALALTVNGTEQPTPAQWTAILAALEPQLSALGWVLVTDLSQADRIIRIDFTPNPLNPGSGHASVLSMTLNPRGPYALALARANSAASSYSYTNYSPLSDPFLGYDRYQRWSDGSYSYSPPPAPTPTHSRNNPDDCPPGTNDRPTRYAGSDNSSSRDSGSWWRGSSSSSSSNSSSNSGYSERSSYTPSSSSSMDSYHSSSSSSSSSYSAPAPSYASESSSASSGGSSGTQDTKAQQN